MTVVPEDCETDRVWTVRSAPRRELNPAETITTRSQIRTVHSRIGGCGMTGVDGPDLTQRFILDPVGDERPILVERDHDIELVGIPDLDECVRVTAVLGAMSEGGSETPAIPAMPQTSSPASTMVREAGRMANPAR